MALVALEIPKVGLVMENARLVRWLKNVGDRVQQGEPLLELETEKSVVEIEATESGRLVEILLHADQEARVGDRIAWIESDTTAAAPAAAHIAGRMTPAAPDVATTVPVPAPPANPTAKIEPQPDTGRVRSSPIARRLAAAHSIDLGSVTGTGPNGRVQLIDVRRAIELRAPSPVASSKPLSNMRRALARSMTLSNATVPQFIVERAVDWTALHAHRTRLSAQLPAGAARPSVNDFLLQAIARTLLSFPVLNSTFSGDASSAAACLVAANGAHIGLVVAIDDGLLVPVFHGVEQWGLAELAARRSETVQRALHGKLKREELEGATFSLSNLGARGPDRFTAIINPPQSAILAVGRQRECVVALEGEARIRPISQLALTVDHRVADGRLASDFLAYLVDILEGDAWRP